MAFHTNASALHDFIVGSAWGRQLSEAEQGNVLATAQGRTFAKGEHIVAAGTPAHHWMGVIRGLAMQSVTHIDGHDTFISAAGDGMWFGEGTLIRRELWGYDAIALRETHVAQIPRETFESLRASNLPFNHFLQVIMNERMGSFVGQLISSRHANMEERVARALADLFNPALYARPEPHLPISQAELAMFSGTSRQRTNVALRRLVDLRLIMTARAGIKVLDMEGLLAFASTGRSQSCSNEFH